MDLSGGTLLALIPVALLVVAFVVFCLVDLIRAPSVRYLPKPIWALIILIGSTPLGAIVYLVAGRDRQSAPAATAYRRYDRPTSWVLDDRGASRTPEQTTGRRPRRQARGRTGRSCRPWV